MRQTYNEASGDKPNMMSFSVFNNTGALKARFEDSAMKMTSKKKNSAKPPLTSMKTRKSQKSLIHSSRK